MDELQCSVDTGVKSSLDNPRRQTLTFCWFLVYTALILDATASISVLQFLLLEKKIISYASPKKPKNCYTIFSAVQ